VIGLSAALLGARIAWAPPIGWAAIQVIFGGRNAVAFWTVQPAGDPAAGITAGVLLLGGVIAYAWRAGPSEP